MSKCEHGLTSKECYVCASPKYGAPAPEPVAEVQTGTIRWHIDRSDLPNGTKLYAHPAPVAAPAPDALENCRLYAARHRKEEWAQTILRFCKEGGATGSPLRDDAPAPDDAPRFKVVYCSQCGGAFGPGNHGYSHCTDHQEKP